MAFNSSIRLYLEEDLSAGEVITPDKAQSHYLINVVRLKEGEKIAVFNGRDGEWEGEFKRADKRTASLVVRGRLRAQLAGPDLHYVFAPLKRARLDYMVQKAVELGVSRLSPVITAHTEVARVNRERMQANVIEAAEQCGIMSLAQVDEPLKLSYFIDEFSVDRHLIYCDEALQVPGAIEAMSGLSDKPVSVLVGPEGGFSEEEREMLRQKEFVTPISLGPRIMRADTAAVAVLSLVNAVLGDWRNLQ